MALSKLVDKQVKMNRKPIGIRMIDIDDIIENQLNKYSQEGIEELAENIRIYGLLKPLEVYQEYDVGYMLIGDHRRLKALQYLFRQGEIDAEIPCLLYHQPDNEDNNIEERMKLIISNAQRDLTDKDKVTITKELLDILKEDLSIKPIGTTTRDWIAPFLGCKSRTVQKYINMAMGKDNLSSEKKDNVSTPHQNIKKLNKMIKKYNKGINDIFWEFSSEEKNIVISTTEAGEDITIDMVINKLAGITMLITDSFDKLKQTKE
ncbi:MAG: ParB N-terminal domain-containing protein [Erysipelotrichales bacterium]|nr:ParB N-terminal domain-containing protein [Erysipelotrichales bacterium]